jgi:hypothetical protein
MTRVVATCRTYHDLRRAIADHCARNGITREALDVAAGLADGHSAKLLAPRNARRFGQAIKRFGSVSLGRVLDALELEIVLRVRDDAQAADLQQDHAPDDARDVAPARQDWRRNRGSAWGRRMAVYPCPNPRCR